MAWAGEAPLAKVTAKRPVWRATSTQGSVPPKSQVRGAWPRARTWTDRSPSSRWQVSGVRR